MTDEVITLLQNAVRARKNSLKELRERIATLLAPIPVGTQLHEENGAFLCEVVTVYTGASQWSNTTWQVTIEGVAYLATGRCIVAVNCDQSKFDGHNMHFRSDEPYVLFKSDHLNPEDNPALDYTSDKETRDIATKLPAAIAKYLEECKQEQEANDATLQEPAE